MRQRIPIGEWLPDVAPLTGAGATIAKNVMPTESGYSQAKALSAVTGALTEACWGHIVVRDDSGTIYNYAGDDDDLYVLNDETWDNASKSASVYTTGTAGFWEFAKFGQNLYATNLADPLQVVSLGSVSNNFADAPGSPPQARHIGVIRDFLVLGHISGTPERLNWSGVNDPTTWAISATTQADVHDFPDGGEHGGHEGHDEHGKHTKEGG